MSETSGVTDAINSVLRAPLWVSGALSAAGVLLLTADRHHLFAPIGSPYLAPTTIGTVIVVCLFVFRAITLAWSKFVERRGVRKPFKSLTNTQRQLLLGVFRTGTRSFQRHDSSTPHWIEELCEWGYIVRERAYIIMADTPDYYSVTGEGWAEIRRFFRAWQGNKGKSKLARERGHKSSDRAEDC